MSLPHIRDEWRVPARYGARVTVDALDRWATVIGCEGDYVTVHVDALENAVMHVHPTDLTWHKETR